MKDLTNSNIERQNILNNKYALQGIQEYIGLTGMFFDGEYKFTKEMLVQFFNVDISTLNRYLATYEEELKHNGYILSKGKQLKEFKLQFGHLINKTTKTTALGLFNFRSFLNLAMLLKESENAQLLRSKMLDIVIDTINNRTGGGTKFINRRDANYFPSALQESNYRKDFTSALSRYVNMGNYKYSLFTDKIYQCIFKENAKEYKQILKLAESDNLRETMYAEVLNSIASFETGLAFELEKRITNIIATKTGTNELLRDNPYFIFDEDEEFDCTYANFWFRIPEKFTEKLLKLEDKKSKAILGDGEIAIGLMFGDKKAIKKAKDNLKKLKI